MTKKITAADRDALSAALGKAVEAWYDALPDDAGSGGGGTTPPAPASPIKLLLAQTPGGIAAKWTLDPGKTATNVFIGRDGKDSTGAGPWTTTVPNTLDGNRVFDKLLAGTQYKITVAAKYSDGTASSTSSSMAPGPVVTAPGGGGAPGGAGGSGGSTSGGSGGVNWLSGLWTANVAKDLTAMEAWRGRKADFAVTFPTYDEGTTGLESMWWLNSAVVPAGLPVCVGIPMAVKGGDVSMDLSASMTRIAAAMKADGRQFILRFGWEFNGDWYPWSVTDALMPVFRTRWTQYYKIFKDALGSKGLVAFNPNGGDNKLFSGTVEKAWVVGAVDLAGPDRYDAWPGFTSDAAVATQYSQVGGLKYWSDLTARFNTPMFVPEWGCDAVNTGDNARYIDEMVTWFKSLGNRLYGEAYFNQAQYAVWAAGGPTQLPKAAAEYKRIWSGK